MKKTAYFMIFSVVGLLVSCEKDTVPSNFAPELSVHDATGIYRFGATLGGSIHKTEECQVEECGIMYSLYPDVQQAETQVIDVSAEGDFFVSLTGLEAGKMYYYCMYASSGYSTVRSETKSFETLSTSGPVFSTCIIENSSSTSIEVSTELLDDGGEEISEFGYVYKQVDSEADKDFKIGDKGVSYDRFEGYKAVIADLESGKKYGIRPYGKSDKGKEGYGETVFGVTDITSRPTVSSCTLLDATETAVTVYARILSEGTSVVTERGFFYSMENNDPTEANKTIPDEGTTGNDMMIAVLSGLLPQQTYYIRAYAKNSSGYGYGEVTAYSVPSVSTPSVFTSSVTEITETSAKVAGDIKSDGSSKIKSKGFCWSTTNSSPTIDDSRHEVSGEGTSFATVLTGLVSGQKYYVRFYAENSAGISYGNVVEFVTVKTDAPALASTTVSDISTGAAHVFSSVTSDGGSEITEKGFLISHTNVSPTVGDRKIAVESSTDEFNTNIDGLTEGTTYYVRSYAVNKNGTSYGAVASFTTTSALKVSTANATEIGETSAKISGSITSGSSGTIKSKGFCWSTTNSSPTIDDSRHEVSGEGTSFATVLTGLVSGQKYYVRFYAENSAGISYGNVVEFVTVKTDAPALASTTVSDISTGAAHVFSSVTSDGGSEITEKGFLISHTNVSPTVGDRKIVVESSTDEFDTSIDGLTEGTIYYVRSYAVNKNGTRYGVATSFTTLRIAIPDISGVWYCVEENNSRTYEYMLTLNKDGSMQIDGLGYSYLSGSWSLSTNGSFTATGHVIATQTQNTWDRYRGNVDDMSNPTKVTGVRYRGNANQVTNVENAVGTFTMTRTSSKLTPSEDDPIFPGAE